MKVSYSAPAKLILSGEHAAVYGKPLLISAINLRLGFSIKSTAKKNSDRIMDIITEKVKEYLTVKKITINDIPFEFSINSKIPVGRNLGSSAALSVASSAAFLEFFTGQEFEKEEINKVAYEIEKYFHKRPSGGDSSASCFGGLIYYRKEFEFLKNISALQFRIPKSINDNIYIIDSGKSTENTGQMVEAVGSLFNNNPVKTENILNQIEKVTKRMVVSIVKEDRVFFKECLLENAALLEKLNVVSKKTKHLLDQLSKFGVGKVTGAGGYRSGSGNILFLSENNKKLEEFLEDRIISFIKFEQDFEGVRKEL